LGSDASAGFEEQMPMGTVDKQASDAARALGREVQPGEILSRLATR
jgi:hypothetical protein